jgi:hypothetical protein
MTECAICRSRFEARKELDTECFTEKAKNIETQRHEKRELTRKLKAQRKAERRH